jgi:hypothetical protein
MSDQASGSSGKSSKKTGLLIFFLIVIIAALVGAVIYLAGNRNEKDAGVTVDVSQNNTAEKRNVVVNKENVEELIEQLAEEDRVVPGNYEVIMNTTWNFTDGESASYDAYVENSEANTNDVYFDIYFADSDEKIFESPVLPRGSFLKNIKLDKTLAAGSYDCEIVYTLIDEEQNALSDVRVAMTINIEE